MGAYTRYNTISMSGRRKLVKKELYSYRLKKWPNLGP
jgi:hypothetical protein